MVGEDNCYLTTIRTAKEISVFFFLNKTLRRKKIIKKDRESGGRKRARLGGRGGQVKLERGVKMAIR